VRDLAKDDEVLVQVSQGKSSSLEQLFTARHVNRETLLSYPYNASVIVTFAVYAERGIRFATAKLVSTGRFKLANDVTHSLKLLESRFTPVMSPGSDLFVSAVSPIVAIRQEETSAPRIRAQILDEVVHVAGQEILTRVGGAKAVAATVCLLTALAVCISVSVVLLQRMSRSRQRYAPLMADRLFDPAYSQESLDISHIF